ncbi:MAG: ATP synthase subunit I [Vicinamibacterales bacterium]
MDEPMGLAAAFAAGGGVGLAYFAGLWLTVRALPAARNPALLVFGSFLTRFGVAATTFVLLVRAGGWRWMAAALAGFVLARTLIIRRRLRSRAAPAGNET